MYNPGMRRSLLAVLVAAALGAAAPSAPAPAPKKAKPAVVDPAAAAVEAAVRQYVADQVEEEGTFTVEDDLLGRSWDAKLIAVRRDSLRRLAPDRVSLCVEFKGTDGKDSLALDIDFTLSRSDGEWNVDEDAIHRVGGTSRFSYGPKGERIPVKGKAGAARKAGPPGEPGE